MSDKDAVGAIRKNIEFWKTRRNAEWVTSEICNVESVLDELEQLRELNKDSWRVLNSARTLAWSVLNRIGDVTETSQLKGLTWEIGNLEPRFAAIKEQTK